MDFSYRLLLYLHILTAIVALGVTFAFPFLQSFAEKNGVVATRFAHRAIRRITLFVVYPGAALVFLWGLGLIFEHETGYKDDFPAWLMIAIMLFIAIVVLDVLYTRRQVEAAIQSLEGVPDGAELPAAYRTIASRIQAVGGLEGLGVVVIAFLMVWGRERGF